MSGSIYENMRVSRRQFKYAVRRLKRCNDQIQNEKFISGIIKSGRNIFDEVRKFRGSNLTVSSRIDEEVGARNIAEHFASRYKALYNTVENGQKLDEIHQNVNNNVEKDSLGILAKINENLVNQAIKKLKPNKRDALYDTSSDCYINGPNNLRRHITNLVRMFLSHGTIPKFVLVCNLIPLVKDGLGDITSSENYRAIAGGCLLLKILDIVILLLEGEKLEFSELQFAYQSLYNSLLMVCNCCN